VEFNETTKQLSGEKKTVGREECAEKLVSLKPEKNLKKVRSVKTEKGGEGTEGKKEKKKNPHATGGLKAESNRGKE